MNDSRNNSTPTNTSIFQQPFWVVVFALTAATVWGWAYPLIKLGFQEFEITTTMTSSKLLFAGIRFGVSGIIILSLAKYNHKSFKVRKHTDWWYIFLFTMVNTTIHYACFYIGLSHSAGARAAILNSVGVFIVVVLACIFFKSDKFTLRKATGCIVGLTGIYALNIGAEIGGEITFLGDGLIVMNALCGAIASLLTRGLGKRIDVFVGTGYSLGIGGALLIIPALLTGGTLPHITLWGLTLLALLIGISTIGFSLYNKLVTVNPVGKITIFNSLIPIIGAITSCMCLGETFYWKYAIAATLATTGIYVINKGKK